MPPAFFPQTPDQWPQWLDNTALALRRALLDHPDGARGVALGADLRRATALGGFFERTIVVLHEAGFGLPEASRATGSFIAFVIGRTAEEQSLPDLDFDPGSDFARPADLVARMPVFTRAMTERFTAGESPEESFRFSVGILIAGLQAMRTAR
ncbi:MAG TPA: TetR/AcrR family transcriptional regulator C-terminal domain-containing protein [Actinocrinis sp.]|nr:TetR/AcrR family transcriptional regulator C-terminal domain-containing protein [Actinocrinis sp.]